MKKAISLILICVTLLGLPAGCGSSDNAKNAYVFKCVDENGKGVEGVTLQVCTEEQCVMFKTDKMGTVVCTNTPAAVYEVHVLSCPEGYTYDRNAVYTTSGNFESHTFTLTTEK